MLNEDHIVLCLPKIGLATDEIEPFDKSVHELGSSSLHFSEIVISLIEVTTVLTLSFLDGHHFLHLIIKVHNELHDLVRIFPEPLIRQKCTSIVYRRAAYHNQ